MHWPLIKRQNIMLSHQKKRLAGIIIIIAVVVHRTSAKQIVCVVRVLYATKSRTKEKSKILWPLHFVRNFWAASEWQHQNWMENEKRYNLARKFHHLSAASSSTTDYTVQIWSEQRHFDEYFALIARSMASQSLYDSQHSTHEREMHLTVHQRRRWSQPKPITAHTWSKWCKQQIKWAKSALRSPLRRRNEQKNAIKLSHVLLLS